MTFKWFVLIFQYILFLIYVLYLAFDLKRKSISKTPYIVCFLSIGNAIYETNYGESYLFYSTLLRYRFLFAAYASAAIVTSALILILL